MKTFSLAEVVSVLNDREIANSRSILEHMVGCSLRGCVLQHAKEHCRPVILKKYPELRAVSETVLAITNTRGISGATRMTPEIEYSIPITKGYTPVKKGESDCEYKWDKVGNNSWVLVKA